MRKENYTSPSVYFPIWLSEKLTKVKEHQAYCKMFNGWRLMKDADGWYYRSKSKLKEDFGMNPNCSDTRVTDITKRFEELGILHIKSDGKKANWYKFDEDVLFHLDEEDRNKLYLSTKEQIVPKGKEQIVPKQEVNDRNKLYLQYNNKENNKQTIQVHVPEDKTEQKENDMKQEVNNQQVQVPLSVDCCYDEWVEVMDDDERKRQEQEYLQWVEDNKTNGSESQRKRNNDYVSRMFQKFDELLHLYITSTSTVTSTEYNKKLYDFNIALQAERSRFTPKQWTVIEQKIDKWVEATEQKYKFFNGQRKKTATVTEEEEYTSEVNDTTAHITSDVNSESEDKGGRAAPLPKLYTTEMIEQVCDGWTMEKLVNNGMETTIGKWQTALEKKTNGPICYDDFKKDVFDIIAHEPMVAYA